VRYYPARSMPAQIESDPSAAPVRYIRIPLKTGLLLLATAFAAGFAATAWFIALVLIPSP